MRDILNFLTEVKPEILERNLSAHELVEIYNATTWEEVEGYNNLIQEFLNNNDVPLNELRPAISFFYLKCNLLENNLIPNES